MFRILILVLCLAPYWGASQELTGNQLLQESISYHDPNNNWPTFCGNFKVTMTSPNNSTRESEIQINIPEELFALKVKKGENTLDYILKGKDCDLRLNGSTEISQEQEKTFNLTCERAKLMKDYYNYLYGLPMKLEDPGTIIDPKVHRKTFKNKAYLVLKVTYEAGIGGDTWYFYFDPKTYAMEVYQFYHDESKNDGEYIILSGEETISEIRMPKTRAWYYNDGNAHLGTDILTKK